MNMESTVTSTELAIPPSDALIVEAYADPAKMQRILTEIERYARAEVADVETEEGRAAVKSLAYKVARSKTALDDAGKRLGDDARKTLDQINASRRDVRNRLDALKDEVRKPLTEWEEAEAERVRVLEARLARVTELAQVPAGQTPGQVKARIAALEDIEAAGNWQEFEEGALPAIEASREKLTAALEAAEKAEADRLELERLRAAEAEREKAEAERREREEAERRRAEEAERQRQQAELQAKREQEAREKAEADAQRRAAEAERQAKEREERARQEAVDAERRRAAAEAERANRERRQREENERIRAARQSEITADLVEAATISSDVAERVAWALLGGKVRNVTVQF